MAKATPNVGSETPSAKIIDAAIGTARWDLRRDEVYDWLLLGLRRADILEKAARNDWTETADEIDEIIAAATDQLAAAATINPDAETGKAVLRCEQIYHDAMKGVMVEGVRVRDLHLALSAQKEISRICANKAKAEAARKPAKGTESAAPLRLVFKK